MLLVSSFPVHVSYNHRHMVIRRTLTMISGSLNYLRLLTSEKKNDRDRDTGVFLFNRHPDNRMFKPTLSTQLIANTMMQSAVNYAHLSKQPRPYG